MITYNWDLAIKLVVVLFTIGILSETFLGIIGKERSSHYNTGDAFVGFVFLCIMIMPVFY